MQKWSMPLKNNKVKSESWKKDILWIISRISFRITIAKNELSHGVGGKSGCFDVNSIQGQHRRINYYDKDLEKKKLKYH